MKKYYLMLILFLIFTCNQSNGLLSRNEKNFVKASQNARLVNEAFKRCQLFVNGWLTHADTVTGLIPRNLHKDKAIWNASDAAADNYPFMVLTAAITDKQMFEGRMKQMLATEKQLTSRLGNLPDNYSFASRGFQYEKPDLDRIIFGGSEYVKDGLMPLTEWLGHSPWSERMLGIVDDIWKYAPYPSTSGNLPAQSHEVNGEMMQVLARLFWMTGNNKYLEYGFRLADYYLLENNLLEVGAKLRLRDHGCEIASGLTEIYAAAHFVNLEKKKQYEGPIHRLFDRILEVGRNEHGMFYNWVDLSTGEHDERLCDTFGYTYNGFYTLYLIDGTENYRQAVIHVLSNLNGNYRDYDWENGSADGYADTIESALNLYNREQVDSTDAWIDFQTQTMWRKQQPDGLIEAWHGDGNFARTSIMYALWKSKGLTIEPWRDDVLFGADWDNGKLYIYLKAEKDWQGKLKFDFPRHKKNLHLPLDYPRINQFPEWFTVDPAKKYLIKLKSQQESATISGEELLTGWQLMLKATKEQPMIVQQME